MIQLRSTLTLTAALVALTVADSASAQVAAAGSLREQNHATAARCVPADAEFGAIIDVPQSNPFPNPIFSEEQAQRIQDAAYAFIQERAGFDVSALTSFSVWFNGKGDFGGCLVGGVSGLPSTGVATIQLGDLDALPFGEMVLAYADEALMFGTTETLSLVSHARTAAAESPISAGLAAAIEGDVLIAAVVQSPELSDEDDPGIAGIERVVVQVRSTALEARAEYEAPAQAETAYALFSVARTTLLSQIEQERAESSTREFGAALMAEMAGVVATIFFEEQLDVAVNDRTLVFEMPLDMTRLRPELAAILASIAIPAFMTYREAASATPAFYP